MDYLAYLQSPEWQDKRSQRLKIDQYKCQRCGRPMDLQVHHLTYDRIGNENVYTDLITLCKYCHEKIESQKQAYKEQRTADKREKQLHAFASYKYDWRRARRLELEFCKDYERRDYSGGGDLNLTNMDTARAEWNKWLLAHSITYRELRVSTVIDYFRNKRIKMILSMVDAGASPDEILARGISYNMVHKYYNNSELAHTVMARFEKEMEGIYAET